MLKNVKLIGQEASLLTHQLFLEIIHSRVYTKSNHDISNTQFSFCNCGTKEALCTVNGLKLRCLDTSKEVYACFIDYPYENVFDRVRHD